MKNRFLAGFGLLCCATAILQVVLLRESLALTGGNEIAVSLGLTSWLVFSALGIAAVKFIPQKYNNFALSFLCIVAAFIPFLSLFLLRSAFNIFHIPYGTFLPTNMLILCLMMGIGPTCLISGALFNLANRNIKSQIGIVYTAEAIGWLIGGFFITWVFSRINAVDICLFCSIITFAALYLINKKSLVISGVFLGLAMIAVLSGWGSRADFVMNSLRWKPDKLIKSINTPYGQMSVIERASQRAIFENGRFWFTCEDELQPSEELASLTLLNIDKPRKVLLIGAYNGLLNEVLKYKISEITICETDPAIAQLALSHSSKLTRKSASNPRVHFKYGDTRRIISEQTNYLDAIIVNTAQPSTSLTNRLFTLEFFKSANKALKQSGVLAFGLPGSDGYLSANSLLVKRNASIYNALSKAFDGNVGLTQPNPWLNNYFIAKKQASFGILNGRELSQKLIKTTISNQIVTPEYLEYGLDVQLQKQQINLFKKINEINSDIKPTAYLMDTFLTGKIESSSLSRVLQFFSKFNWLIQLLFAAVFCFFVSIISAGNKSKIALVFNIAVIGFAGMALTIVLFYLVQIILGALYHYLGLVTAVSMAGMAFGASLKNKLASLSLSIWILITIAIILPFTLNIPNLILSAGILLLASFLIGLALGNAFRSSVILGISSNRTYFADLLGASAAGIFTALLFLPSQGLLITCAIILILLFVIYSIQLKIKIPKLK